MDTPCLQTRRIADGAELGDRWCCLTFNSKAVVVPCARIERTAHVCTADPWHRVALVLSSDVDSCFALPGFFLREWVALDSCIMICTIIGTEPPSATLGQIYHPHKISYGPMP